MYKLILFIALILIVIASGFQPGPKTCSVPILSKVVHAWALTGCQAAESVPGNTKRDFALIEENELYENDLAGIRIRGSIPASIKKCRIYSNGRAGIRVDREGEVTVTGCSVFDNKKAGIEITEAGYAAIEENRIYKNKMAGVRIESSKINENHVIKVRIANNRIYLNNQAGIRSLPQPGASKVDLSVVGNIIYENKKAGVSVKNSTRLTAAGNHIHDNGTVGIIFAESVIPPEVDIYQNRVSFNRGPGIHVVNGITGSMGIRNNRIFNNQYSGIVCGLWGSQTSKTLNIEIVNNTVVSNGSKGRGAGIRNDGKGRAMIMNNIIAYNYTTGIMTKRCRGYSYNLLYANGDTGACRDRDSVPFWAEKNQFAGCSGGRRGDLICEPLFVDPDRYNFRLQDESPAIDAGRDTAVYDDTSFPPSKGTKRNDMGATGGPYAVE